MFAGEILTCQKCGFKQKSDPSIESGWYKIQIDRRLKDICPRCLGNPITPKCSQCGKYYHEDYSHCPWCKRGSK